MFSHDPIFETNKNRIHKNGPCKRALGPAYSVQSLQAKNVWRKAVKRTCYMLQYLQELVSQARQDARKIASCNTSFSFLYLKQITYLIRDQMAVIQVSPFLSEREALGNNGDILILLL